MLTQGERSSDVYFVTSGTCRAVRKVVISNRHRGDSTADTSHHSTSTPITANPSAESGRSVLVDLGTIESRWYFGEIAALGHQSIRTASVYCVTKCTLYKINKENFLKLIPEDVRSMMLAFMKKSYPNDEQIIHTVSTLTWRLFALWKYCANLHFTPSPNVLPKSFLLALSLSLCLILPPLAPVSR